MIAQKSSNSNSSLKYLSNCEICKAVHDREREATSRCLECQKFLCRHCVQAHQNISVTRDHSIYELEIEKDILCKVISKLSDHFSTYSSSFSIIQPNSFDIIVNNVKDVFVSHVLMLIIVIMN